MEFLNVLLSIVFVPKYTTAIREITAVHLENYDNKIIGTFRLDHDSRPTTLTGCHLRCAENEFCLSYFYIKDTNLCFLHSIAFLNSSRGSFMQGSVHYQVYEDWCLPSEGYVLFRRNKVCYKVYNDISLDYSGSKAFCASKSESLLEIRTEEKQTQIQNYLKDYYTGYKGPPYYPYYIGATKNAGVLRWEDGTPVGYTLFPDGEPSSTAELCINIFHLYWFKWNDGPCDATYRVICERYKS